MKYTFCFVSRCRIIIIRLLKFNRMSANPDYQPTDEDVDILREWLKKMPHIVQDYDDVFLAAFIRGRKGSLQKAKIVMEKFNSIGFNYPEIFGHLDIHDETTQGRLKDTFLVPLPKRLDDGAYVFVISTDFNDTESKKSNVVEIWRYWQMIYYIINWENGHYVRNVTIFDWKNISLGHAKEITPVFVARLIETLKSIPIRVQAVYNINVPPALQWILSLIKSLASKKLADRIHFISSIDTLYESIPRKILPKEYGGNEEDMRVMHSGWLKKVESYKDRLVEENDKMRRLDPLRPKDEGSQDMVGTFKALNVD